ncbi:MAG: hypothetical protein ACI9FJ_001210 [Alteromonadaceae bacterium]
MFITLAEVQFSADAIASWNILARSITDYARKLHHHQRRHCNKGGETFNAWW